MTETLTLIVNFSLIVMMVLLPIAFISVARGESNADRLLGVEMITTLLVGITILLALVEGTDTTIDIGIGLAALSFAGTISFARYISEGRVF